MTTAVKRFLERLSPGQVSVLGFVLVILVGIADHFTGYELSFSIFYLAPIAIVTWYAWKRAAFVLCCFSAVVWFAVEFFSGQAYSNTIIPVLNACVRFGFFFTTMALLNELKILVKQQQIMAATDGLTGLMNSRAFKNASHAILHLAVRHKHPVSLGYIDLDNFKSVNDRFGHSEGDRLIQAVAKSMASSVRETDVVGRLGGDEFAILLPETDCAGARELFGRIREVLIGEAEKGGWPIGFSVGVAVFPVVCSEIEDMLKIADRLMYDVKKAGKNSIIVEEQPVINQ